MRIVKKILNGLFFAVLSLVALFTFFYMYTSGKWYVAETVAQDSTISHITIELFYKTKDESYSKCRTQYVSGSTGRIFLHNPRSF